MGGGGGGVVEGVGALALGREWREPLTYIQPLYNPFFRQI